MPQSGPQTRLSGDKPTRQAKSGAVVPPLLPQSDFAHLPDSLAPKRQPNHPVRAPLAVSCPSTRDDLPSDVKPSLGSLANAVAVWDARPNGEPL